MDEINGFDLSFEEALSKLKQGCKVAREGWNGKGMFLLLVDADMYQYDERIVRMVSPDLIDAPAQLGFIALKNANNSLVPWVPSQSDLLSDDWELVR